MQKALELMNLKLTSVLGDVTGVTGLKIIRAILAGQRDPQKLARLRDRRCRHTAAEMAEALDGRYRSEHVTELRCCLAMWEKYQEVIGQLDGEIAAQLRTMRRRTEPPPLPPKTRVRGRKPHDPRFDVRTALYYATGIDLTAIEGIDELHALTLVSELGTDFTKWPTVKQFTSWLGLCPNWQKTGGKVKSSRTRRGKNRAAHALRLAAWSLMRNQRLPWGRTGVGSVRVWGAQGDHGDGAQAGADRVLPGALRDRVRAGRRRRRMPSECMPGWRSSCVAGRRSWALR